MSVITHLMGRLTKDPVMQQGKNNGTEYISLDLAVTQRSQNSQNGQNTETMYYQCFFNKHLADRLLKANVKKGTCLYVYGDLEIHPFIYQQGQKAGQGGVNAKVNVKDWQFCLAHLCRLADTRIQAYQMEEPIRVPLAHQMLLQIWEPAYQQADIQQRLPHRRHLPLPMQETETMLLQEELHRRHMAAHLQAVIPTMVFPMYRNTRPVSFHLTKIKEPIG